jgi:hypothetical protein
MAQMQDSAQMQDRAVAAPITTLRDRGRAGRGRKLYYRVRHQYGIIVGGTLMALILLITLAAPLIAPYDPIRAATT